MFEHKSENMVLLEKFIVSLNNKDSDIDFDSFEKI